MDLATKKFNSHESNALSPINTPPTLLFNSHLHSSHTGFPIIAVAIIGILATAFLLISYYIFVIKCCLNLHRLGFLRILAFSRGRRVEDPLMIQTPVVENRGLDEALIRSIPILKFKNIGKERKSCECAICLNKFQEEEKLRVIPNCAHVFHIDCIDIWLQNNANCPLCRTSISGSRPDVRFPMDQILPNPFAQYPNPDNSSGRDEDYVVIEIGSESDYPNPSLLRIQDGLNSGEFLSISPSLRPKISRKKKKKINICSMGDECIDNRKKDEQFAVQHFRRSFSMDSAADRQLFLVVHDVILKHPCMEACDWDKATSQNYVNSEVGPNEDCSSSRSRVKRSFFSFGQGWSTSRNAIQPVTLDPQI